MEFDSDISYSDYTQILLISNKINDLDILYNSANNNTFPIIYSYDSSFELTHIINKFYKIKRIGICFLDKETLFMNNSFFSNETIIYLSKIITDFSIENIDFLACSTLNDPSFVDLYSKLRKTGVIIGASNNKTGNIQYGGDWIMESTGQDISNIYFTSNIYYYKYLLDSTPYEIVTNAISNISIQIINSSSLYDLANLYNISSSIVTNNVTNNYNDAYNQYTNINNSLDEVNNDLLIIKEYTNDTLIYTYNTSNASSPNIAYEDLSGAIINSYNASSFIPIIYTHVYNSSIYNYNLSINNISVIKNVSTISNLLSNISLLTVSSYNNYILSLSQGSIAINTSNMSPSPEVIELANNAITAINQTYTIYTKILSLNQNISTNYLYSISNASTISYYSDNSILLYNSLLQNKILAENYVFDASKASNFAIDFAKNFSIQYFSAIGLIDNISSKISNIESLYTIANIYNTSSLIYYKNSSINFSDAYSQYINTFSCISNVILDLNNISLYNSYAVNYRIQSSSTLDPINASINSISSLISANTASSYLPNINLNVYNVSTFISNVSLDSISVIYNLSNSSYILYNISLLTLSALYNFSISLNNSKTLINLSNLSAIPTIINLAEQSINASNIAYNNYLSILELNKNISNNYFSTYLYYSNVSLYSISTNNQYNKIVDYKKSANNYITNSYIASDFAYQYYIALNAYQNSSYVLNNSSNIYIQVNTYNASSIKYRINTSLNLSDAYIQNISYYASINNISLYTPSILIYNTSALIYAYNASNTTDPIISYNNASLSIINASNESKLNTIIYNSLQNANQNKNNIDLDLISSLENLSNISSIFSNVSILASSALYNFSIAKEQASIAINSSNIMKSNQISTIAQNSINASNDAYNIYINIIKINKNISSEYISTNAYITNISSYIIDIIDITSINNNVIKTISNNIYSYDAANYANQYSTGLNSINNVSNNISILNNIYSQSIYYNNITQGYSLPVDNLQLNAYNNFINILTILNKADQGLIDINSYYLTSIKYSSNSINTIDPKISYEQYKLSLENINYSTTILLDIINYVTLSSNYLSEILLSYNSINDINKNINNIYINISNLSYETNKNYIYITEETNKIINASNASSNLSIVLFAKETIKLNKIYTEIYNNIIPNLFYSNSFYNNINTFLINTNAYYKKATIYKNNIINDQTLASSYISNANISIKYALQYSNALSAFTNASNEITNISTLYSQASIYNISSNNLYTNSILNIRDSSNNLYNIKLSLSNISSIMKNVNTNTNFAITYAFNASNTINTVTASYNASYSLFYYKNASNYNTSLLFNISNSSYYNINSYNNTISAIYNLSSLYENIINISFIRKNAYENYINAKQQAEIAINISNTISTPIIIQFAKGALNASIQTYSVYNTIFNYNKNASNNYLSTINYPYNSSNLYNSTDTIYNTIINNQTKVNTSINIAGFVSNYALQYSNVLSAFTNASAKIKNSSTLYLISNDYSILSNTLTTNIIYNNYIAYLQYIDIDIPKYNIKNINNNINLYTASSIYYAFNSSSTTNTIDASTNAISSVFNASNASSYITNLKLNISNASYYNYNSSINIISTQKNILNLSSILFNISYSTSSAYNNYIFAMENASIAINISNTMSYNQFIILAKNSINASNQTYTIYKNMLILNNDIDNTYKLNMTYFDNISMYYISTNIIFNELLSIQNIANISLKISSFVSKYATQYSNALTSFTNASQQIINSSILYSESNLYNISSNNLYINSSINSSECNLNYVLFGNSKTNITKIIPIISNYTSLAIISSYNASSTMNTVNSSLYSMSALFNASNASLYQSKLNIEVINSSLYQTNCSQNKINISSNVSTLYSIIYNISYDTASAYKNYIIAREQASIAINASNSMAFSQIINLARDAINSSSQAYTIYTTILSWNKNVSNNYISSKNYISNVSFQAASTYNYMSTILNQQSITNVSLITSYFVANYANQYYKVLSSFVNASLELSNLSKLYIQSNIYNTSSNILYSNSIKNSSDILNLYDTIVVSDSNISSLLISVSEDTLSAIQYAYNSSSTTYVNVASYNSIQSVNKTTNVVSYINSINLNISNASYYNYNSSNTTISFLYNLSNISSILFNISYNTASAYNNYIITLEQASIAINASNTMSFQQIIDLAKKTINSYDEVYSIYKSILSLKTNVSNNYISTLNYSSNISTTYVSTKDIFSTLLIKQKNANISLNTAYFVSTYATQYSYALTAFTNASSFIDNASSKLKETIEYDKIANVYYEDSNLNISNAYDQYIISENTYIDSQNTLTNISQYATYALMYAMNSSSTMNNIEAYEYSLKSDSNATIASNLLSTIYSNLVNLSTYSINVLNSERKILMNINNLNSILTIITTIENDSYYNYINASTQSDIAINSSNTMSFPQIINLAKETINATNQIYNIYTTIIDFKTIAYNNYYAATNSIYHVSTIYFYETILEYLPLSNIYVTNSKFAALYSSLYSKVLSAYTNAQQELQNSSSVYNTGLEYNTNTNLYNEMAAIQDRKSYMDYINIENSLETIIQDSENVSLYSASSIVYAINTSSTLDPPSCFYNASTSLFNLSIASFYNSDIILNVSNSSYYLSDVINNSKNVTDNSTKVSYYLSNMDSLIDEAEFFYQGAEYWAQLAIDVSFVRDYTQLFDLAQGALNASKQSYINYENLNLFNINIQNKYNSILNYKNDIDTYPIIVEDVYKNVIRESNIAYFILKNASNAYESTIPFTKSLKYYVDIGINKEKITYIYLTSLNYNISCNYLSSAIKYNISNTSYEYSNISRSFLNISYLLKSINPYILRTTQYSASCQTTQNGVDSGVFTRNANYNISQASEIYNNIKINAYSASTSLQNISNNISDYIYNISNFSSIVYNMSLITTNVSYLYYNASVSTINIINLFENTNISLNTTSLKIIKNALIDFTEFNLSSYLLIDEIYEHVETQYKTLKNTSL